MRILVVGSDKVFAIENFYIKYLQQYNVEVKAFNAQSIFFDYYESLINKVIFRFGYSGIYRKINKLFRNEVDSYKPDIIWIFKGMEIMPDSLKWAKSRGIKLASYNPDNPFIFTGRGSGNRYVTESIGLYDIHFTYNFSIERRLQTDFGAMTRILPFGFDVSDELYERCRESREVIKVCFIGNPDLQRAEFIQRLLESGIEMDIYGNDWRKFIDHANARIYPPVYGDELWKKLRQYRVQLNLMRVHNEDSHNMRSFEVPGIGGILVEPDTLEHRLYFVDRKEVFLYSDLESCAKVLREVLSLQTEEADKVREFARIRSLTCGYSYKDRALFVKDCFTDLLRNRN